MATPLEDVYCTVSSLGVAQARELSPYSFL